MNEKNKRNRIRTTVRAGQAADSQATLRDRVMFVLLDALQKPTDWIYARWIKKV